MFSIKRWPSVGRLCEALIVLVILFITLFAYRGIFLAFFQQDEWWGYSQYILHQRDGVKELISYFFTPSVGHFTPLTLMVLYGLFSFGMKYQLFASVSLILHLTSIVLVYFLAKLIFKDVKLSVFTALLFGLSAPAYQGTAWVAADIATHGATIFGLLSSIYFFKQLDKQKNKYLYLSLLFLFISLLFKEIGIGLLILFPILVWIFFPNEKKEKIHLVKKYIFILVMYLILRGLMFFVPRTIDSSDVFQSQPPERITYNLMTIPIKAVSQSLLPENAIRNFSDRIVPIVNISIVREKGTTAYGLFLEKIMETASLVISILFIIISLFLFLKNKNDNMTKVIILGLVWIVINSFVFAFVPETSGIITSIDSRYLYFISIGTSLFITSFTYLIFKKRKYVFFVLIILCVLNFFWLNQELAVYVERGAIRKEILGLIKKNYPQLPQKTIFYLESDRSYYGLPPEEKIVPFQSGFGETLLSWYYQTETFPVEFFRNRFLWDIGSQGYREYSGRGFGYFRQMQLLKEAVRQYNIPRSSVISFSWDSNTETLRDISISVREKIYDEKI